MENLNNEITAQEFEQEMPLGSIQTNYQKFTHDLKSRRLQKHSHKDQKNLTTKKNYFFVLYKLFLML